MSETLTQGGLVVSLLANAALVIRDVVRWRRSVSNNETREDVAREQGAASVVPTLADMITDFRTEVAGLRTEAATLRERVAVLEAEYAQQGAALAIARGDVVRLSTLLEELLPEDDVRRRAEVAEIRARNSTPQPFAAVTSAKGGRPAMRPPPLRTPALATVSDRKDMKPRGGEE